VTWRIHPADGSDAQDVRLRIVRPAGGTSYESGGASTAQPISTTQALQVFPTRLPIRTGDHIGLDQGNGSVDASISRPFDDAAMRVINPRLPDSGAVSSSSSPGAGAELVLNADIEADADGDGFGEPTQDKCATDPTTQGPCASPTPAPAAAEDCLNAQGGVAGKRLGPAQLGRLRALQRAIMQGARLLTRLGLDKYCATGGGLFRIGYPTGALMRTIGRALRRLVDDRVVLILTSSPRFRLGGIVPSRTSESDARRRLRGEQRLRVGKNTWYVTGIRGAVLRLVKAQRGRVREIGIGDARLAEGNRQQLKRYLRAWAARGF
jgi:hypothetical protein